MNVYKPQSRGKSIKKSYRQHGSRVTEEEYKILATQRGLFFIGPYPKSIVMKAAWQCSCGNIWLAAYHSVRRNHTTSCHSCAMRYAGLKKRFGPDKYRELASRQGLEWMARQIPQNSITKVEWRCSCGRLFMQSYTRIKRRNIRACPYCRFWENGARVSTQQRNLHRMIGGELNYLFEDWWIDIAFPKERIAIEYDSWYFHAKIQSREETKRAALFIEGWKLINIKSNYALPTMEQMEIALSQAREGIQHIEITLDDWGIGPSLYIRNNKKPSLQVDNADYVCIPFAMRHNLFRLQKAREYLETHCAINVHISAVLKWVRKGYLPGYRTRIIWYTNAWAIDAAIQQETIPPNRSLRRFNCLDISPPA